MTNEESSPSLYSLEGLEGFSRLVKFSQNIVLLVRVLVQDKRNHSLRDLTSSRNEKKGTRNLKTVRKTKRATHEKQKQVLRRHGTTVSGVLGSSGTDEEPDGNQVNQIQHGDLNSNLHHQLGENDEQVHEEGSRGLPQMKRKSGDEDGGTIDDFDGLHPLDSIDVLEVVILEHSQPLVDCVDTELNFNHKKNQKPSLINLVCNEDRSNFSSHVSKLASKILSNFEEVNKNKSNVDSINENLGSNAKSLWRVQSRSGLEPLVSNWNFLEWRHLSKYSRNRVKKSSAAPTIALDFLVECNSLLPKIRLAKERALREASIERANQLEYSLDLMKSSKRELRREIARLNSVVSNVSLYSKALVRCPNIIVWKVNSENSVVKFVSKPGCESILNYKPQDLISHKITDTVYKDDRSKVRKLMASKCTQRIRRFDKFGRMVWLEAQSYPNNTSEQPNSDDNSSVQHSKQTREDVVIVEFRITELLFDED